MLKGTRAFPNWTEAHPEYLMVMLTKQPEQESLKKRERIQRCFWNEVGTVEHISLPKLRNAVAKEFKCNDGRLIETQIELMQIEARIRIQSKVKVWIKQPKNASTES